MTVTIKYILYSLDKVKQVAKSFLYLSSKLRKGRRGRISLTRVLGIGTRSRSLSVACLVFRSTRLRTST
jgi:hypothetical protein